jgi:hypothetical protein
MTTALLEISYVHQAIDCVIDHTINRLHADKHLFKIVWFCIETGKFENHLYVEFANTPYPYSAIRSESRFIDHINKWRDRIRRARFPERYAPLKDYPDAVLTTWIKLPSPPK